MNKLFKFHCNDILVLLPLNQVIKIEFVKGDKEYDEYNSMLIFFNTNDGECMNYSFSYDEKNEQTIVKALEDFYSNNISVLELEKDLPFISE